MKIMFASGTMQGGGAERVISTLANEFVARGFDVAILVVRGESVYELDGKIQLIPLYEEREFSTAISNKIARRLVYISRLIHQIKAFDPDVLIPVHGGGWNALFILLAKLLGRKVVACENTSHVHVSSNIFRRFERHFMYRFADAISVLTRFDFSYYSRILDNVVLLPNPIGFGVISKVGCRPNVILAAGRLDSWKVKGFDNLLDVFKRISHDYPNWRLKIAGSGHEGEVYLRSLVRQHGLSEAVEFTGFCKNIDEVMRNSAIFTMTSRYEGFGMVLAEAMSQGAACVSFDCEAGPADIIDNLVSGILVPNQDVAAMESALRFLIDKKEVRVRLATTGLESIKRFSVTSIANEWVSLFHRLGLNRI
jgi:GalNAc-alpha-(1->4)-GalNAc-alpha-(1->3)-diNAcBac-PP-undecaprenol alpha-1,4-N-acetyl-D-galactosaminyltransferase